MTVRIYVAVCALYHACVVFAVTRYVSPSGSGTPPYTNWATAAKTIQPAVDLAAPGDLILVGNGVYKTGGALTPGGSTSNRVVINKAVTVESANGYQGCLIVGHQINDLSAVRCAYVGGGGVLKGFTLTNGMAPHGYGILGSNGGGAFVATNSTVRDCLITCNESIGYGGGVYVHMGGTVYQCTIVSNSSTVYGGGACIYNGGTVRSCVIRNNGGYAGGGVACMTNGLIADCTIIGNNNGGVRITGGVVTGCFIALNTSDDMAGGVYADAPSVVVGCTIISNRATYGGGGGIRVYYNISEIKNCMIAWNSSTHPDGPSAGHGGGGVTLTSGGRVRDCIVRDNRADNGGGVFISQYQNTSHVENCTIENNHAYGSGGGVHGYGYGAARYALISNCILRGNSCSNYGGGANLSTYVYLIDSTVVSNRTILRDGGGVRVSGASAASSVQRCTVFGNRAGNYGGGVSLYDGIVQHTRIYDNYASAGGGVDIFQGNLRNCLVTYNRATNFGGVWCWSPSGGLVESCTISDNHAFDSISIGGLSVSSGARVRNTIVYFNTPRDLPRGFGGTSGAVYFAHCCLSTNITGNNNISGNPLFSNRAAYDYRLLEGSPCVDKGTNQPWMFLPAPNNQDIYGQPRIQNFIVDIGAAEGVIPEPLGVSIILLVALSLHKCGAVRARRRLL